MTPIGLTGWTRVNEPDTKYKPEGEYKVELRLDPTDEEVQELLTMLDETLDKVVEDYHKEGVKYKRFNRSDVYTEEFDDDTGDPTGYITLKFKKKASHTTKTGVRYDFPLPLYDSEGTLTKEEVWGGSKVRVSFYATKYAMDSGGGNIGLSLKLDAVQIVELNRERSEEASKFGFGKVEGGYVAPTEVEDVKGSDEEDSGSCEY